MRIYELFEAPFAQPGIQPGMAKILNLPNIDSTANDSGSNNSNTASKINTMTAPTGPVKATPPPAQNQANPTNNSAVQPQINQQLAKGSVITMPVGPGSKPTTLKVSDASNNNLVTKDPTITLTDPQNPQISQTVSRRELADYLAQQKK